MSRKHIDQVGEVVCDESKGKDDRVDVRHHVRLDPVSLDGGVSDEERVSSSEVIIPRSICIHMVLQYVLAVPTSRGEPDGVEGEIGPETILGLVHPIVPERAEECRTEAEENRNGDGAAHVHGDPEAAVGDEAAPEPDEALLGGAASRAPHLAQIISQPPPYHRVESVVVQKRRRITDATFAARARDHRPGWPLRKFLRRGNLVLRDDRACARVVVVV
mmetsp:Transcript_10577/g.24261  ORF Transcript_10577/g.24261 Transcript_10577/m.24261 type:complete len:218 (-) Transcript_10577:375-1028(-)